MLSPLLSQWVAKLPASLAAAQPKRQREFLLGRHCAARALDAAGCDGVTWLPVGADRLPSWPPGWLGSISHAGSGAIAAVARRESCRMLGVDMERLMDDAVATDVHHLIAQRDELELVSSLGMRVGMTLLFSAKEALYKALYPTVRQFFDFTAARAVALDRQHLVLQLTVPWGEHWPVDAVIPVRLSIREDYVFTAVHAGNEDTGWASL